jgi:hypothetical protein
MQKPRTIPALFGAFSLSVLSLGLGACMSSPSDPPAGETDLEIRHTGAVVNGSEFTCTGAWPSVNTPCGYSWTSQPATQALSTSEPDAIELVFGRTPIPVDGGASTVYLKLRFATAGMVNASAREATTAALGAPRTIETSSAIAGFVDPAVMGRTPQDRNAGKFSLTFPWGSISGTYDTAQ